MAHRNRQTPRIDLFRRNAVAERKHEELARELEALEQTSPDLDSTLDNTISHDLLRLVFIACHPILPTESRAALTLRLLGLTTDEIARSFLTPEPTIAQRIVRAKRTLADKHIPFEVPRGPELAARLTSVLEVLYLIFNEGYSRSWPFGPQIDVERESTTFSNESEFKKPIVTKG
jgi:predicted RNA polymerase sigma factor